MMTSVEAQLEDLPVEWADLWPRHKRIGTAEAYCGAWMIITISRAFSADEDQIFQWALEQDQCSVWGIYHMRDGRDLILFDRMHTKQTVTDAEAEHLAHLGAMLRRQGISIPRQASQHDTATR